MQANTTKRRRGVTIMELMITVIIIGIIARFGLPTYNKAMDRAKERDALHNLEIIRESLRLYMAKEGDTTPPPINTLTGFKNFLHLNLIEQQGNTYRCRSRAGNPYLCQAINTDGWAINFNNSTWTIQCSTGTCPTLP